MSFGRALAFYFSDDHWFRKVLATAAAQFIPVLGLIAAAGWALDICRRTIHKDPDGLPAFAFRRNFSDGMAVWGIILTYGLPLIFWLGAGGILSATIFPAGRETAAAAFDLFWGGIEIAALVIMLGAALGMTAAVGRFADTGVFREAFRLPIVFSTIRSDYAVFSLVVLAWLPLGVLAVSGIAVCWIGVLFTNVFALGSGFHLAGQAYALAASRRISPIVLLSE